MVDINQFINAPKISWIRRSITEDKDCFIIHNTMYPFYKKCLIYGSGYIKMSLERINNPFWKDTYSALRALSMAHNPSCWKIFWVLHFGKPQHQGRKKVIFYKKLVPVRCCLY